jgi:glycerol-3-phosphate dehydrogenase (NAD(P)+)
MPITNVIYNIMFKGKDPLAGVEELMKRGRTHEKEDIISY